MVWIALVLAAFLFYRFVERRHKIIFFKIAGGLLAVGALVVGGFAAYNEWSSSRAKSGIKVELSYKESLDPKQSQYVTVEAVAQEVFLVSKNSFSDLEKTHYELVKRSLFEAWLPDSKENSAYAVVVPDEEFQALFATWKAPDESKAAAEAKLTDFEDKRATRYIAGLNQLRKQSESGSARFQFGQYLARARDSFQEPAKSKFLKTLDAEDRRLLSRYDDLWAYGREQLYSALNAKTPLKTKISFQVCNQRSVPLLSYSFYVSGFLKDRSTSNPISTSDSYGSSTRFESDIIVESKKCGSIEWSGPYKFYQRYEISGVNGRWQE